jgi:hypothetical protein
MGVLFASIEKNEERPYHPEWKSDNNCGISALWSRVANLLLRSIMFHTHIISGRCIGVVINPTAEK